MHSHSLIDELYNEAIRYHKYLEPHIDCYTILSPFELELKLNNGTTMVFDSLDKTVVTVRRGEVSTKEEWNNEFGRRLNRALWKRGLTQEELATAVGISRQSLGKYLAGKATPSVQAVTKLSRVLNCPVSDLVDFD